MPDNDANRRPLDTSLPDDLAACESKLAGISLPPSQVSRDDLIYRAGWAAAEAQAESPLWPDVHSRQSSLAAALNSRSAWSLASATIAATLAVVITLWCVQPTVDSPGNVVVQAQSGDANEMTGAKQQVVATRVSDTMRSKFPMTAPVNWTGSLLIMRDRALLQQWDDGWMASDASLASAILGDEPLSRAKTSREILQEFLPAPSVQNSSDGNGVRHGLRWPWSTTFWGDTT